jgi:hypothetical protein
VTDDKSKQGGHKNEKGNPLFTISLLSQNRQLILSWQDIFGGNTAQGIDVRMIDWMCFIFAL